MKKNQIGLLFSCILNKRDKKERKEKKKKDGTELPIIFKNGSGFPFLGADSLGMVRNLVKRVRIN